MKEKRDSILVPSVTKTPGSNCGAQFCFTELLQEKAEIEVWLLDSRKQYSNCVCVCVHNGTAEVPHFASSPFPFLTENIPLVLHASKFLTKNCEILIT